MKVLDDFLYPELYQRILNCLDNLEYDFVDCFNKAKKYEAKLSRELAEEIKACYQEKVRKPVGFFTAGIVRCDPNYKYHIHYDHPSKLVSTVVYLHPEVGDGTYFLKEDKGDQVKVMQEIVWHPNRLVSWVNTGQKHMYQNTTDAIRCTLNIYQKKENKDFEVTLDD